MRGEIYTSASLSAGAAGQHIATYENDLQTPTTFFTHTNHLGTERVETAVNGSSCETITNTAFGDGLNTSGSCDPSELRFTGKQRDWESNLDYFGARFYSSQLARFMSADWSAVPAPVPYANLSNPQTLNLYVIVSDNPETFADLDGHCETGETAASACVTPPGACAGSLSASAPVLSTLSPVACRAEVFLFSSDKLESPRHYTPQPYFSVSIADSASAARMLAAISEQLTARAPGDAISAVRIPDPNVRSTAFSTAVASRCNPHDSRSNIAAHRIAPIGFAEFFPASCGADP